MNKGLKYKKTKNFDQKTEEAKMSRHSTSTNHALETGGNQTSRQPSGTTTNYELSRAKLRYSNFQTGFLIVTSTIGMGLYTFQYAFAKVGYLLGSATSILTNFFTIYGIYRLTKIADKMEGKKDGAGASDLEVGRERGMTHDFKEENFSLVKSSRRRSVIF